MKSMKTVSMQLITEEKENIKHYRVEGYWLYVTYEFTDSQSTLSYQQKYNYAELLNRFARN